MVIMVTVDNRADVEDAAIEFLGQFGTPVTTASRFYTYLYLADIKGIDQLEFDLFKLENSLADAFLNYTVYAVAGEIGNKDRKLNLASMPMGDVARQRFSGRSNSIYNDLKEQGTIDRTPGEILREVEADIQTYFQTFWPDNNPSLATDILLDPTFKFPRGSDEGSVINELEIMEEKNSILSRPFRFLKAAQAIFNADYRDAIEDTEWYKKRGDGEMGWNINYGGEAWGAVCETARNIQSLSEKAYIDLMFSVEHNNGNFLNKVPRIHDAEYENITEFFPTLRENRFRSSHLYDTILPAVLDAAKEENIKPLYRIAKKEDSGLRKRFITDDLFPREGHLGVSDEFGVVPDKDEGEIL